MAACLPVQKTKNMKKSGLARTGRPHYRHELAFLNLKI